MEKIPGNVRSILAISDQQDITKLAEQADKIIDFGRPASTSSVASPQYNSFQKLTQQIESLQKKFEEFGRSRSRHRSYSRKRSNLRNSDNEFCWYHKKVGSKANKCKSPCKYPKN